jgi:hypothetical protein
VRERLCPFGLTVFLLLVASFPPFFASRSFAQHDEPFPSTGTSFNCVYANASYSPALKNAQCSVRYKATTPTPGPGGYARSFPMLMTVSIEQLVSGTWQEIGDEIGLITGPMDTDTVTVPPSNHNGVKLRIVVRTLSAEDPIGGIVEATWSINPPTTYSTWTKAFDNGPASAQQPILFVGYSLNAAPTAGGGPGGPGGTAGQLTLMTKQLNTGTVMDSVLPSWHCVGWKQIHSTNFVDNGGGGIFTFRTMGTYPLGGGTINDSTLTSQANMNNRTQPPNAVVFPARIIP